MNIKDFAEKFIKAEDEAWQKGNISPLEKMEDPNVAYHMGAMGEVKGFEAHKQYILGYRIGGEITQEWKYLTGDGDVFALSYKSRTISNGKLPILPPAGKEMTTDSIFVFRVKNDRIIEAWYNGTVTGLNLAAMSGS